jgi:hypothetical protein
MTFQSVRQAKVQKLWWVVIAALMFCQLLGQLHRIQHHLQIENIVSVANTEILSSDASLLEGHQCVLFDALSLTPCLNAQAFTLNPLQDPLGLLSLLAFKDARVVAPRFFQSRAPPHFIL